MESWVDTAGDNENPHVIISNYHFIFQSILYNFLIVYPFYFFSEKYTRFCQWKNLELNIQVSHTIIVTLLTLDRGIAG